MEQLHVTHRPEKLKDVVGQGHAVAALRSVLQEKSNRALLFHGPSGCGKTTLARIVAREVECVEPREIDAATYTGVDDARALRKALQYRPLVGKTTVLILDEAHRMSKNAWDAMLKTIEEPPKDVWICLCTTEPNKVPKTISNRCAVFALQSVKTPAILKLVNRVVEAEELDVAVDVRTLVARHAEGSPRRALTLLSKVWQFDFKDAKKMLGGIDEEGDAEVIELCRALMTTKWGVIAAAIKKIQKKDINSESVRYVVQSYFTKVMLGGKPSAHCAWVLECFRESFGVSTTIAPLVSACARVAYGGSD